MILWRLSGEAHARAFDGGYGFVSEGRWNSRGQAVTYCSTSPALCVLEKLVHVQNPDLLPPLVMVRYEAPDDLEVEEVAFATLPPDWTRRGSWSQQRGDAWHAARRAPLLRVSSVILPLDGMPDRNVVVNHAHPDAGRIRLAGLDAFMLDPRLI